MSRELSTEAPDVMSRVWAFSLAAAILLVPANILPVVHTVVAGEARTDTIFSGVLKLADEGLWPLATIVFVASFVVPLGKLVGLLGLALAVRRGVRQPARLSRWYAHLDFIGRWSMLDVFLVAFLAGTVQFGVLAQVEPRPGLLAFGAAVIFTMLATRAFNPALLWAPAARRKGAS